MTSARRLLFCSRSFYLDDSNGAAVAHRTLARSLVAWGTPVEALSGVVIDGGGGADPAEVLATRGIAFLGIGGDSWAIGAGGIDASDPANLRASVGGVPLTVSRRPLRRLAHPDPFEVAELLRLFEATRRRFRPDVLVTSTRDAPAPSPASRGS